MVASCVAHRVSRLERVGSDGAVNFDSRILSELLPGTDPREHKGTRWSDSSYISAVTLCALSPKVFEGYRRRDRRRNQVVADAELEIP